MDKKVGQSAIENIPESNDGITMTFISLFPSFKIIKKIIPLGHISSVFYKIQNDCNDSGIDFKVKPEYINIVDYHKFVKSLFVNFDVEDFQKNTNSKGHPDFRLNNVRDGSFYIEFKSRNDSIPPSQILWCSENPSEEVWFLVLGDIYIFDDKMRYLPRF